MNIWVWTAIAVVIAIFWVVAGTRELKPPKTLIQHIERLKYRIAESDCVPVVTLDIDAKEFCHDDIEKEIYIVRKSRSQDPKNIHFNVRIQTCTELMNHNERDKTIRRLERRFPGIDVQFLAEGLDVE